MLVGAESAAEGIEEISNFSRVRSGLLSVNNSRMVILSFLSECGTYINQNLPASA